MIPTLIPNRLISSLFPVLWFAGSLLLFQSCRSSSEIIVVESPALLATPSTESADNIHTPRLEFRYAELDPVLSFDPLYALNNATLRIIQLSYEGLVRLDETMSIKPALAKSWQISEDSLVYTFIIQPDVFFHDSQAFISGIGRKFFVNDVYNVFSRMTSIEVPPDAAKLFKDVIFGFDAYNNEQRNVYVVSQRQIDRINGISIVNDSTVAFTLNFKDPHFLHRLASPLASIYPIEVSQSLQKEAIGTGPFTFEQNAGDTLYTFRQFASSHQRANKIRVIRVYHTPSESKIFRHISSGIIDMIPEIGPVTFSTIIDKGALQPIYLNDFSLIETIGYDQMGIFCNPGNSLNLSMQACTSLLNSRPVDSLFIKLRQHGFDKISRLNSGLAKSASEIITDIRNTDIESKISILMRTDYLEGYVARMLYNHLQSAVPVTILSGEVVSRETVYYTESSNEFIPVFSHPRPATDEILSLTRPRYTLVRENIRDIRLNSFVWWMDVTNITISDPSPDRQIQ